MTNGVRSAKFSKYIICPHLTEILTLRWNLYNTSPGLFYFVSSLIYQNSQLWQRKVPWAVTSLPVLPSSIWAPNPLWKKIIMTILLNIPTDTLCSSYGLGLSQIKLLYHHLKGHLAITMRDFPIWPPTYQDKGWKRHSLLPSPEMWISLQETRQWIQSDSWHYSLLFFRV